MPGHSSRSTSILLSSACYREREREREGETDEKGGLAGDELGRGVDLLRLGGGLTGEDCGEGEGSDEGEHGGNS